MGVRRHVLSQQMVILENGPFGFVQDALHELPWGSFQSCPLVCSVQNEPHARFAQVGCMLILSRRLLRSFAQSSNELACVLWLKSLQKCQIRCCRAHVGMRACFVQQGCHSDAVVFVCFAQGNPSSFLPLQRHQWGIESAALFP